MDEEDELKQEAEENKVKNTINSGKNKLANMLKAVFSMIVKKFGKWILAIALIIILFVLLFNEFEKVIFTDVLSSIRIATGAEDTDGDGKPDADIDFAAKAEIIQLDGTYCLKIDKEVFKKIEKQLEESHIDPEDLNINEENFDCFKEFIKAEITTQYPRLGNIDKEKYKNSEDIITDGIIEIERATDGQTRSLEYMPKEEFEELCNNGDSRALDYFSLDEERNLLYASYTQTDVTVTSSGDTSIIELPQNSSTYEVTLNKMDYLSVVRKYTMPFALQLAILQTSDSENFALEFAKLAQTSEMTITIQDNIEKSTYVEDIIAEQHISGKKSFDYKIYVTDTTTTKTVTTVTNGDSTSTSTSTSTSVTGPTLVESESVTIPASDEPKECTAQVTTVVEEDIPTLELTKVNCWNAVFENKYEYKDNSDNPEITKDGPNTTEEVVDVECDINTDKDIAKFITGRENYWKSQCPSSTTSTSGNVTTYTSTTRTVTSEKSNLSADVKKTTTKTSTLEVTTITKTYTTIREKARDCYERIRKIFSGEVAYEHDELNQSEQEELKKELREAYGSLKDAQQWFYSLLERDEQTKDLVDIMKYYIKKFAGDSDAGEFDFSDYNAEDFSETNDTAGLYGDSIPEKIWWALIDQNYSEYAAAGVLGNIEKESGFYTNNLQNTYESSLGSDKVYTQKVNDGTYSKRQFVNDSAGYGLAQWTDSTRKGGLYKYKEKLNVNIDDENMQIDYLIAEITGKGNAADCATKQMLTYNGYGPNNWKNAQNVREATIAFCWSFERPGEPDLVTRIECAKKWYNKFHGKTKPRSKMVQYYQDDYSNVPYGSSNIARCGCGPTCFAMVATALTGKTITPKDAVDWCGNSYYVWGSGTSWSYFQAAANHFNLEYKVTQTTSINEVTKALKKGEFVISSQSAGLFTRGGHFILLAEIDNNNKITVKDPNKNNAVNKGYNDRKFTTAEINSAARQYFIFEKK